MRRRRLLGMVPALLLAAGRTAGAAGRAEPASGTLEQGPPALSHPQLLVAGPAESVSGRWASVLAPGLAQALGLPRSMPIADTGGRDGVTGANAFDALTAPDGATAMLVPGAAALAWLAGDPRVHFDAGRWVPALAAFSPAVVVGRGGLGEGLAGKPVRIGASTVTGVELPALLGLFLLSAVPVPVFGLSRADDAETALRDGRIDAMLLSGPDIAPRLAALRRDGYTPLFSLAREPAGGAERGDATPGVIELASARGSRPDPALLEAWRATATAATMQTALVLPLLTPAAVMARWRLASGEAVAGPLVADHLRDGQADTVAGTRSAAALDELKASQAAQLALRRWIAERTGWRRA
ncbi:MAG: hypothetical protein INR65_15665 [Gluconacetobacter diazotrophicus]|nr:hypothetical protein [Gluconacetobacter diazotrophicus]